ncbi:ribosome assembly RNA-binding protein YhbY [Abyssicoccus albus]|uniref:RNA-binding protein n=1 Tax=Abyssicoccus albus TaxID=1817405 RepID=A0A1Q1G0Z4_9BACL|nr:ribosome assembly RNA-binding protein YhbY [Abyssicoccus albus]AQL56033.1 RNA-binding protein [Abyssicoccus albus]RPF58163.1 RNA-binding protein [Abyssicoccus albus]
MKLTGADKRYLRKSAHHLNAPLQIGKEGINDNMLTQINEYLEKHELIKISVLQNNDDDMNELAMSLAQSLKAEVVQIIGSKIILYKKNYELKSSKYSLPSKSND